MHYRTITLKQDATCHKCGRTIPAGSTAHRNVHPGSRVLIGISHINDCTRYAPRLQAAGTKEARA